MDELSLMRLDNAKLKEVAEDTTPTTCRVLVGALAWLCAGISWTFVLSVPRWDDLLIGALVNLATNLVTITAVWLTFVVAYSFRGTQQALGELLRRQDPEYMARRQRRLDEAASTSSEPASSTDGGNA